jgi:hypothetical protein
MFGKTLVEMATGKLVNSLDDISTLAASGALALSLPVLQVCFSTILLCHVLNLSSPFLNLAGYQYNRQPN